MNARRPDEQRRDRELAQRLADERPIPDPGFRAALRHALAERSVVTSPRRGEVGRRARRLVAAYATSGLALIAVAAAGVAGLGPLAT